MKPEVIIQKAEFNPKIKRYLLIVVAFVMFTTIIGIPILLFWFLGLGQYICRRYYDNLTCRLTDRHLIYKKGILVKVEKTIPLENIQDLTFLEGPILSYFGLKILKIETAGHSKPQGSDMKLIGIIDADIFKEKILDQREIIKTEPGKVHKQTQENNTEIIDVLMEIKTILLDMKNKNT